MCVCMCVHAGQKQRSKKEREKVREHQLTNHIPILRLCVYIVLMRVFVIFIFIYGVAPISRLLKHIRLFCRI